jgi:hypothetical protein
MREKSKRVEDTQDLKMGTSIGQSKAWKKN